MDRKEVIKITLDMIKERKLEKTSIGEIVKKLGSSPGSLYYHFTSKRDIYKETVDYSVNEISKSLNRVEVSDSKQSYLFDLTKTLIKFLEKEEEILFFLISIKGSCYLEKEMKCQDFLINFKKIFLDDKKDQKNEEMLLLKLNMFLGSVYEVLYNTKLIKNRNLKEEEIDEIYKSFWGNIMLDNKYNN